MPAGNEIKPVLTSPEPEEPRLPTSMVPSLLTVKAPVVLAPFVVTTGALMS